MSGIPLEDERYIDWLSGTVPVPAGSSPSGVARVVGEMCGGASPLDHGALGYSCGAAVLGSGRVFWHPERAEMGVHFQLSATALERLEDWQGFVQAVLGLGGHFTRCDLALDQHETDIETVRAAIVKRQVVSHFRKAFHMQNLWGDGETCYLGSSESDSKVRFYDKRAERLDKGEAVPEGVWVRCEVQFRRKRADAVVRALLDGEDPRAFVRAVVDFRELEEGQPSNRCLVLEWWDRWLAGVKAAVFDLPKKVHDLDKWRAWVLDQVMQTLACLLKADDDNPYWLLDQAQEAWAKVPKWKRKIVDAARAAPPATNRGALLSWEGV